MARFDDQPTIGKQDLGYRSDEVRGPYREGWAESSKSEAPERTDSPGGTSGLGKNQNPLWAGAQASLESESAGRGLYGSGEEGASGYGQHRKADGEMPSSPTKNTAAAGASASPRPAEASKSAVADEGFGTRHWGHGEFKGDDGTESTSTAGNVLERAAQSVGRFFGIGPKGYRRSNERVHEDVCEALKNHHEINAAEVEVKVADGVVSLTGTVDDRQMRRAVEDVVRSIPGVLEIENHLRTEQYVARTEEADRLKTGEADVPPELHS